MPFTIVQAGSSLQAVSVEGDIETLVLPSGVVIDPTVKGYFHTLGRQLLFTVAPSINLWIDPVTFTVRPMVLQPPSTAPTLTPSGTGLTGDYRAAYSFGVQDANGNIIAESPLSPVTDPVTAANEAFDWSDIAVSTDSVVNCRVLYRSLDGGDAASLFQVTILTDNIQTAYAGDDTPDDALGLLPAAVDLRLPPGSTNGTGFSITTLYKSRIFGLDAADPDHLLWSAAQQFSKWPLDGGLRLEGDGEDQYGGQGFLPRRDDLVIVKRSRVMRLVGDDETNFELKPDDSSANAGCIAPKSCLVIDNVGYWLGADGVYVIDDNGVRSITNGIVGPWFKSDLYLSLDELSRAEAGYNPLTHSYELMVPSVGSGGLLNEWLVYDIAQQTWWGPHFTLAFTPLSRALIVTAAGVKQAAIGGSDGYIYLQNQTTKSDIAGGGDTKTAITWSWIHSFFHGDDPDFFHYWAMPTWHYQNEALTGQSVTVDWLTGNINDLFSKTTTLPLTVDRFRSPRLGAGRLFRFKIGASVVDQNFLLRGLEVYFNTVGRR